MHSLEEETRVEPESLTRARALLEEVLSTEPNELTLFGSFVLHGKPIGQGGFGIVFRAQAVGEDEEVALKQILGGAYASPEQKLEFLAAAETAAALDHPGIVKILGYGKIEGCPYLTMTLLRGGNLAAKIEARPLQDQAVRWLQRIALAVHHAHSCGVLHRDLKPANILLDEHGQAFVADFGSAKRLSQQGQCLESGNSQLSHYTAPEQADSRGLTRATDIYALGAILHELLTGRAPYEGLEIGDWIRDLLSSDPVRPLRELVPDVDPRLELICLKCLEKDPTQRYASADLLAEDLERVLQGWRPRHAVAEPLVSRGLRWVRRRPLRLALAVGAGLFGLVLVLSVLSLLQTEREQQRAALETNAFIANSQAGALLFQLREFADRVERCGQKPGVQQLLTAGAVIEVAPALEGCARGFQAVYVSSLDGQLLAQWPPISRPVLGRNYAFREYFIGARYLGEHGLHGAFLSPAYRAESNGLLQFAVAAPVTDRAGVLIGVAIGGHSADSAIGEIRMQDSSESGRIVALLGPRGKDRLTANTSRVMGFDYIVHPRLELGREVAVEEPIRLLLQRAFGTTAPPGEQFSLRWAPPVLLSDFRDPLLDPAHTSLAAFAPVGQTGYVVVVETSKNAVQRDGRALLRKLAWRAGIPFSTGLSLLGFWIFSTTRRKRSLRTRLRKRDRSAPAGGETSPRVTSEG